MSNLTTINLNIFYIKIDAYFMFIGLIEIRVLQLIVIIRLKVLQPFRDQNEKHCKMFETPQIEWRSNEKALILTWQKKQLSIKARNRLFLLGSLIKQIIDNAVRIEKRQTDAKVFVSFVRPAENGSHCFVVHLFSYHVHLSCQPWKIVSCCCYNEILIWLI